MGKDEEEEVNKLQLSDHKNVVNFDFDWLTLGRPDRVKTSMFAFFVSANVAKLFFKLFTLLTNLFFTCDVG